MRRELRIHYRMTPTPAPHRAGVVWGTEEEDQVIATLRVYLAQSDSFNGIQHVGVQKLSDAFLRSPFAVIIRMSSLLRKRALSFKDYRFTHIEVTGNGDTGGELIVRWEKALVASNTRSIATHDDVVSTTDEITNYIDQNLLKESFMTDTMHNTISGTDYAVTTVTTTLIYGCDASKMTDEGLIDAIRRTEEAREALLKLTTKSEAISKRIESLADAAMQIAAILDERSKAK